MITTLFLLVGVCGELVAQKYKLSVQMQVGMSNLFHDTRFQTTELRNLYETVAISHPEGYEWEQFEETYQLRQSFTQFRYGMSVTATHRRIPLILIGDVMSSTSSYERLAYAVTLGFGEEFSALEDNIRIHILGGMKRIWDQGFGANTLVNSIGHQEARSLVATYFAPEKPLGPTSGWLFALRGGIAKTLDSEGKWSMGGEAYYELDVTARIKRESRMTNLGLHVFMRYHINQKQRAAAFNNNASYYY